MSERERGEAFSLVTVTVPTLDEIRDIHHRVYGKSAMYEVNPQSFRLLRSHSKEILFDVGYDQGTTLVVHRPGDVDKVSGETTALYAEVKRLIEEHVRTSGISMYTYQLTTDNPAMLVWARGKGKELFVWDQEIPFNFTGHEVGKTAFIKHFIPRKSF